VHLLVLAADVCPHLEELLVNLRGVHIVKACKTFFHQLRFLGWTEDTTILGCDPLADIRQMKLLHCAILARLVFWYGTVQKNEECH